MLFLRRRHTKAYKGIVKVGDQGDLVVINKMSVYEVQVHNTIRVIPEA